MKANELMIGDWVAFRGHPYQYTAQDIATMAECEEKGIATDTTPIPLTPEILEKNGFHWGCTASEEDFCAAVGCGYPDSGWCFDEGAGEIKILFPNETDGGLVRLDDQNGDRHIELVFVKPLMVHELQHALRICGIEKEIVL